MIKIFTDKSYLTEAYRKVVFPLLFDLHYLKNEALLGYYQIVETIEECDVAVVPISIHIFYNEKKTEQLQEFIKNAKKENKIIWIYSAGDFGLTLQDDSLYTFRLGGFNSKMNQNTLILPSFINDPIADYFEGNFKAVPKTTQPIIGFTGNASGDLKKYLKEFALHLRKSIKIIFKKEHSDLQGFYPSSSKRFQLLQKLENHPEISSKFIFRKKYRAGVEHNKEADQSTVEYFQNMLESQYILCLRGSGNFSVRFYETLAMGRIPVLIDTDVRLPLQNIIDWNKHCVMVSEKKSSSISAILLEWHDQFDEKDLLTIQKSNRDLYENYLMRDHYFKIIHDQFSKQ